MEYIGAPEFSVSFNSQSLYLKHYLWRVHAGTVAPSRKILAVLTENGQRRIFQQSTMRFAVNGDRCCESMVVKMTLVLHASFFVFTYSEIDRSNWPLFSHLSRDWDSPFSSWMEPLSSKTFRRLYADNLRRSWGVSVYSYQARWRLSASMETFHWSGIALSITLEALIMLPSPSVVNNVMERELVSAYMLSSISIIIWLSGSDGGQRTNSF